MPNVTGNGHFTLRIEQRPVDTSKKTEEVERKMKDGTIVRYQRNVAEGLLHRIGRFFTDLAKGKEKALGTLCDRAPNNVPAHIMVMGHKVSTRDSGGVSGLRAAVEFNSPKSGETVHTADHQPSRLVNDLRLQLDMRNKKSELAATKTFLKYASGAATIPKQISGNSQRRELDAVIRQLKQFSEMFSELEQDNGLHAADAGWVKDRLTQLLDNAKKIQQTDVANHDPVKRLNLDASVWRSSEEFAALQSSIKLPSISAPATTGATPVLHAQQVARPDASPSPSMKDADGPEASLPEGRGQPTMASGTIQLTDGLIRKLDEAFRQHGKELPKNHDPAKTSDWDEGPDPDARANGNIQLNDGLTRALEQALRQHGKALPKNYDPDKDSDWDI